MRHQLLVVLQQLHLQLVDALWVHGYSLAELQMLVVFACLSQVQVGGEVLMSMFQHMYDGCHVMQKHWYNRFCAERYRLRNVHALGGNGDHTGTGF